MTPEEFDINFDFDKMYGDESTSDKCSFDDDFDLDAALARELGPDFDRLFEEEYAASQAALNAQTDAARKAAKVDMDATKIRLEIGHEDEEDLDAFGEEPDDDDDDDAPKEAKEFRQDPFFSFEDYADEEENYEREKDYDPDPDDDLSAFFFNNAAEKKDPAREEPKPEPEVKPYPPVRKEKRPKVKIEMADVKAGFAAAGLVIKDNASRFVSALKECKPGKMDRKAKRRFKDDVLPVLIGGAALVVCMVFIIGSLTRSAGSEDRQQAALEASIAQAEAEAAAKAEIKNTLDQAAVLAAGYDYQAAIDTLDAYQTADRPLTDEMAAARAQYAEIVNNLVIWDDPTLITNLSFHVLIADPNRAYADALADSYKSNFITTEQFSNILDQLYANGYVLVNLDSCLTGNTASDGSTARTIQPIYLPEGKTPIMITETLVNYFAYMVDGDGDGAPDKNGAGFANKLILQDGKLQTAYVDADGNELVGDYDLVPILNSFIEEHPDFSYRGAKAILAVTGEEGIFGWRTTDGDEATIAGAKEVVAALRENGYQIACNSFGNLNYGTSSIEAISSDLSQWNQKVLPVLGETDILVVARGGELATSSSQFQTIRDAGFTCILDTGSEGTALKDGCFAQTRIMVLGLQLSTGAYASYFTLS